MDLVWRPLEHFSIWLCYISAVWCVLCSLEFKGVPMLVAESPCLGRGQPAALVWVVLVAGGVERCAENPAGLPA